MTTLVLAGLAAVSVAIGYALRLLQERYAQARLERTLFALGGEIPDWERAARKLEDEADRDEIEDWSTASDKRQKAQRVRRVARRRLRTGRAALP